MLFILLHMDTHCSTSPSVSPPLSLAGPQFEIEVDTVIKGVSEISLEVPKASEGACHGTILANKNEVVGDVEREDNWTLDTRNPRNWPSGKKWASVSVVTIYTVVAAIVSSMMAPALPKIVDHFHIVNDTEATLMLSIFMLSFAISPLIYAPLSEIFGRTWVLHINNMLFLMFNLGCAFAPSKGAFIGFRFLCGWAGGAPIAIGGGVVGDLFAAEDRAFAMATYALGSVGAPAIGPAIGGFMAETVGWRYLFVLVACLSAVASVVGVLLYRETYAPVVRLRILQGTRETGEVSKTQSQAHGSRLNYLFTNLQRPFILLTRSIVCFALSIYMAFTYGIYYLMFATFPDLFKRVYHFGIGIGGLAYLGVGIGFILGTILGGHFGSKLYNALAARNGGQGKPEMRVPSIVIGALIVPIGLFWYGWSAQTRTHWVMPIIGTGIFGFGAMLTFLPIQLYLVDTFTYSASALSASAVTRSMLAFALPLAGTQMFDALGLGMGNTLLAVLAIVMGVPFPIWIWFYGERLRARSSLTK